MIRPLEPRVGESRSIEVIQQEAGAFLRELFAEGFFPAQNDFERRLEQVKTGSKKIVLSVWCGKMFLERME